MTLYDTISLIEQIALQQPNVRTAKEGNVFDHLNANPSVEYAAVILTQGQHQQDEQFNHFRFSIFYVDRLLSDLDSNRIQIQSTGKEVLNNIIRTLTAKFDAECDDITYQPFTQRFADECAGVFASVVIDVPVDYLCAEDYADSDWESGKVVIRNQIKSIDIISNGTYNVSYDQGYTGLESVAIQVNVPTGDTINNQDKKVSLSLSTATISSSVTADAGYTGLGKVEIEADASLYGQSQYQSGHSAGYDEGYEDGAASGHCNLQSKSVTYTTNDTFQVSPDGGYDGMSALSVTVNVPQTTGGTLQIQDGTSMGGSSFSAIPRGYDFSQVKDFGLMFAGATNLQSVSEGDINTSGGIQFNSMFYGCTSLTSVSGLDTSGTRSIAGLVCRCTSLSSLQELDASSLEVRINFGLFWPDDIEYPNLTDAGGLKNLKISIEGWNWDLCPNLSLPSCLNILNGLYDFTGHGEQPGEGQGKLKVHPNFITLVGDDISIGTAKGWSITA